MQSLELTNQGVSAVISYNAGGRTPMPSEPNRKDFFGKFDLLGMYQVELILMVGAECHLVPGPLLGHKVTGNACMQL